MFEFTKNNGTSLAYHVLLDYLVIRTILDFRLLSTCVCVCGGGGGVSVYMQNVSNAVHYLKHLLFVLWSCD